MPTLLAKIKKYIEEKMKKTSLILGLAALLAVSLTFMGCPKTSDPTSEPNTTPETPSETPETPSTPSETLADKVVWSNDNGEVFTSDGYNVYLKLDEAVDLTGYNYLNVEFSATDNVTGQNVIVQPMNETSGGHPQGNILVSGAVSKETRQTKFGTTFGKYSAWENGKATEVKIEDNLLGSLQLYVQSTSDWQTVPGVNITVYKVTATNTELK